MANQPITFSRILKASPDKVWKAITDKAEMKQWYFDLAEFDAEKGFRFSFTGGPSPDRQYVHLCEVTEVIPLKKLVYSWSYEGYTGISYVSFELFPEGDSTRLVLTHSGLESFPAENPDFAVHNFEEGWNHILHISLKNYLEPADFTAEIITATGTTQAFDALTGSVSEWWTRDLQGSAMHVGDNFTIRFGNTVKTLEVAAIEPEKSVTWNVKKAHIDMASLQNKSEWEGTAIHWEIFTEDEKTKIRLTHKGLTRDFECFTVCEKGWNFYMGSLLAYLDRGKGQPHIPK